MIRGGGKIAYGSVPGPSTRPAPLAKLLNGVQTRRGVIEQIGRRESALDCVLQPDYVYHSPRWHAARWHDEVSDDGWVAKCFGSYFNESVAQIVNLDDNVANWFTAANALVKSNNEHFELVPCP